MVGWFGIDPSRASTGGGVNGGRGRPGAGSTGGGAPIGAGSRPVRATVRRVAGPPIGYSFVRSLATTRDQNRAAVTADATVGMTPISMKAGRKQVINGSTLRTPTALARTSSAARRS